MSQNNLQHGTTTSLTVENRKTRKLKRICLEVSVNSPGNPWSQSRRRKGNFSIFLKLYLKPIREQIASCGHFHLVIYTSWSVLLLFMCVQLLSTIVLFGHWWQNMILNLLKRFNDALLNDSVDFATCHIVID